MRNLFFLYITIVCFACQSEPNNLSTWSDLDLLEHGIPFSILAPDSANVETIDFGSIMKDVTVRGGDDYFVQIFASDAKTTDVGVLKAEVLKEVKDEKHFSRIVEESDQGFLYESRRDSTNTYYGFRYVRIQGTKEYLLQNGFRGFFTEEQARSMYKAVSVPAAK